VRVRGPAVPGRNLGDASAEAAIRARALSRRWPSPTLIPARPADSSGLPTTRVEIATAPSARPWRRPDGSRPASAEPSSRPGGDLRSGHGRRGCCEAASSNILSRRFQTADFGRSIGSPERGRPRLNFLCSRVEEQSGAGMCLALPSRRTTTNRCRNMVMASVSTLLATFTGCSGNSCRVPLAAGGCAATFDLQVATLDFSRSLRRRGPLRWLSRLDHHAGIRLADVRL
jgi:hypothetical protein